LYNPKPQKSEEKSDELKVVDFSDSIKRHF
jgi:hypothetical protein